MHSIVGSLGNECYLRTNKDLLDLLLSISVPVVVLLDTT